MTPRPPRNVAANIRPTTFWGGVSWESRFEVRREEEDRANREPQTSHLHREQCVGEAEREGPEWGEGSSGRSLLSG